MFGQPTTPFGSPAAAPSASPFGAPSSGAGGFGSAATPAPFGSSAPAPSGGFGGFGATTAPSPSTGFGGFGSLAPTPAAGGFGAFGSPSGTAAGSGAFGSAAQPSAATTPFGSPAPAPGGFGTAGGFGAAPTPASGGLFGGVGTGGFGSSAAPGTGGFGSAAPGGGFGSASSTGFGTAGTTSSAFGASTSAPGGGLFGSAPAPTFGSAGAPTSTFGSPAPAPGGLFGSAPAPTGGGLFGGGAVGNTGKPGTLAVPYQVTSKTDGTGNTMINIQAITAMPAYEAKSLEELRLEDYMAGNKGSMGQPGVAPAQGGFGGFGSPAPAPGGFGTSTPVPGAFGAPAPAPGGLFGSAPAPAFGASSSGGFGTAPKPLFGSAPAPAPGGFSFGPSPAPSMGFGGFGAAAPKPAGGGLFGSAPAPAPGGLFGSAPAPAPGGLFGSAPAPAPGGLFGSAPVPAPAPVGLFGSAPAPAPSSGGLFGAPAPAPSGLGLFGSPAPAASGGLFGAPAPAPTGGGLFGAPTPAPSGGGLFGAPAPKPATGGLFGSPAPGPTGGGLFGAPAPAPIGGGLFGSPSPAPGGLFGAPAPAPSGGFFGAPAPAPSGFFGAPAPGATVGVAPYSVPAGVPPPTADAVLAQQLAAIERQKQEMDQLESWRGTSPPGSGVIPLSLSGKDSNRSAAFGYMPTAKGISSYAASSAASVPYQSSTTPRSGAKIRPRGFGPSRSTVSVAGVELIGTGGGGISALLSPETYLGSSAKRLIIKPGSLTSKPKMRLQLGNGNALSAKASQNGVTSPEVHRPVEEADVAEDGIIRRAALDSSGPTTPATLQKAQFEDISLTSPEFISPQPTGVAATLADNTSLVLATTSQVERTPEESDTAARTPRSSSKKGTPGGAGYDFYQRVIGASEEEYDDDRLSQVNGERNNPLGSNAYLPKLTKAGYSISPSLETLASMSESELAAVSGFSVSRDGIGSVAWDGTIDIRKVDLDSAVAIEKSDVAVYDAEEAQGTKPPVGSKLNCPAVITMYGIFPKGGKDANDESREKFKRKIEKSTKRAGAELIFYDASLGIWKFRVKHFSRYGLYDDDTEEEDEEEIPDTAEPMIAIQEMEEDFDEGDRGGRSPRRDKDIGKHVAGRAANRSRIRAPLNEDDTSEKTDEESLAPLSEEEASRLDTDAHMLQAADTAYAALFSSAPMENTSNADHDEGEGIEQDQEKSVFREVGEILSAYTIQAPVPLENVSGIKYSGFSARLAKSCGVEVSTASNIDFGLRMGRSFRVGWRPDGSFIVPGQVRLSSRIGAATTSVTLFQRKPVFYEQGCALSSSDRVRKSLLESHLRNSVQVDATIDHCPFYALPKSIHSSGGSMESYRSLRAALDDLSEAAKIGNSKCADPEVDSILSRAFSLLSILVGQEDHETDSSVNERLIFPDYDLTNGRRREALLNWLKGIVLLDVRKDVQAALRRGDAPAALFAAISGCDSGFVSNLAADHGYLRLSALVSNNGDDCRSDIRQEIEALYECGATDYIPTNILRVYTLLGGDEELEEKLCQSGGSSLGNLDWRRRFALKAWCSSQVGKLSSLSRNYDSGCKVGTAPYPRPRYAEGSKARATEEGQCILYGLLNLGNEMGNTARIISPLSHTASRHDFSGVFHLASALLSLDESTQISSDEMAFVIDGYVMQLIHAGYWDWAVYVCLCAGASSKRVRQLWRVRAIDIIERNCCRDAGVQRTFLESQVGVSSVWFDRGLAMFHSYKKDFENQALFTSQFAPGTAMELYEELTLPRVLFKGKARQVLQTVESLRKETPGWRVLNEEGVLYQFMKICEEVLTLSQLSQSVRASRSDRISDILICLQDLKARTKESNDVLNYDGENISRRLSDMKSISKSICNAELFSYLSLLELQIVALSRGFSIFEQEGASEGKRLKVASQLALLSRSHEDDTELCYPFRALGAQDVLRGDYAIFQ